MKVRVLGTAAGGGLPQWNCACATCAAARRAGVGRDQDCLAVSGDGRSWYLLNASPDLRGQLAAVPELAPGPGRRETPLRGVLLCTAELDHTIGLLSLREATSLAVYATEPVLAALSTGFPVRQILAPYTDVTWHEVVPGEPVTLQGGLAAEAFVVGAKPPRYAAAGGTGWVVAYRIRDRAGGTLVYAPCLPDVDDAFAAAVEGAGLVLLDGTFLHDDEMTRAAGGGRTATAMGHVPVEKSLSLLPRESGTRYVYTHLNNTNPLAIDADGLDVAEDGQAFEL
ncbi:pyrroloquinoline quinone biosynthesis protein PqqB [Micromonospora sp. CPCC 206061]|uniref:pyrroloquinoline quinone biosynthesis protein PqqB n=1 Tax=Micromonospora sp. CPCC 206061 TaxID=3122410 RepID=UPI002FF12E5B